MFFTRLILVLLQYDFRFCLNLTLNRSATCKELVLYKGNTISHAVIPGYGIACMPEFLFFLFFILFFVFCFS